MKNEDKYFFSDFTHEHYSLLLQKAKERFSFVSYADVKTKSDFIIWRHDVDFSMHEALRLAQIEREQGVKAVYFLLPHSEFYNLLEKSITDKVKEIIGLGHEIGLHFDAAYFGVKTKPDLEKYLALEKNMLEAIFDIKIRTFSFHNPTEDHLKLTDFEYGGMINTYASYLKENVAYCSDSNGYWRFRRMLDVITDPSINRLQALTHPEWWTRKTMSPKEKIWNCIDGRAQANKDAYTEGLARFNREMIDW